MSAQIHPSIVNGLSGVRWQRHHFQRVAPDLSFTGHTSQLWLQNLKVFPGQCRDIISPPGPRPAPGPLTSWMCLERLHMEVTRGHPYQMPEPLQLAPFNAIEQWLYSGIKWIALPFSSALFLSINDMVQVL